MTSTTTFSSHSSLYHLSNAGRLKAAAIQLCCLAALVFSFTARAHSLPPNPPPGPYHQSCKGTSVSGTILTGTCLDFFGKYRVIHMVDYAACTGNFTDENGHSHPRNIFDIDGELRCVIDLKKRPNNDKNDPGSLFDVISVTQATLKAGGTQTLWRIDRPKVWQNVPNGEVDYPMIAIKAGDQVSITAGGCVQTGGTGPTWKQYLNPQGPNSEKYYYGTVSIPGEPFGFAKIRDVDQNKYPIPSPRPGFPNIIKLGYLDDQLDDNGYYRHDDGDGTPAQCAGVGPAWVEIVVLAGVNGSQMSPHSLPFDLVWNVDTEEDENGLPMNPQWNRFNGEQPILFKLCAEAFKFEQLGITREDIVRKICTSMPHDYDFHLSFGYCPAEPIPGHMNFPIATYAGNIVWDSFSVSQGAFGDGDWSFNLFPPDGAGLAGDQDGSGRPGKSLHLEFNTAEVALPWMPFWKDLLAPTPTSLPGLPIAIPIPTITNVFGRTAGLHGVVIGQVGLDGVHGGFTEIHPVYALAVRLQTFTQPTRPDEKVEKWAFFLRNFGDEGFCSHNEYTWPNQPEYFISLPWPEYATGLKSHVSDVARWQDAPTPVHIDADTARGFTLIRVGNPGVDQFGVGGTLELFYKVTPPPKQKKTSRAGTPNTPAQAPRQAVAQAEDDEVDVESLSRRIADPTTRAKFEAAMKALPPMTEPHKFTKTAPVQVPATITERKHVRGAAGKGIATLSHSAPNLAKERWEQEMDNLLKTYEKDLDLKPATPPQPPQPPHPNSGQAPPK
jgi:hypothetical protein